eukprot:3734126-Pyramimonas_sp.AAC.1
MEPNKPSSAYALYPYTSTSVVRMVSDEPRVFSDLSCVPPRWVPAVGRYSGGVQTVFGVGEDQRTQC